MKKQNNYIDEMNNTVRQFMDCLNTMLENDPDINVNSIEDINKKVKEYYKNK